MARNLDHPQNKRGSVLMIVLVIMVAVGFLAAQGIRLMMLTNRAYDQRTLSMQINELVELGRLRLANGQQSEEFVVDVPAGNGVATRVGKIKIEKKSDADDGWRIIVQFPHKQPNQMTVTWESP